MGKRFDFPKSLIIIADLGNSSNENAYVNRKFFNKKAILEMVRLSKIGNISIFNYPQLIDSMSKRRRTNGPSMEASQIVASDRRFEKLFRYVVNSLNHSDTHPEMSFIFVSDTMGSLLDEGRMKFLQLDGTFAVVPQFLFSI